MTKDPTQSLVEFVQDVKPYHTKIVEVLIDYVYEETVNVAIQEGIDWNIGLNLDYCQLPFSTEEGVGGFSVEPFGGVWSDIFNSASVACQLTKCRTGYDTQDWDNPVNKQFNNTLDIGQDTFGQLNSDDHTVDIDGISVPDTFVVDGDVTVYFPEGTNVTQTGSFANRGETWKVTNVTFNPLEAKTFVQVTHEPPNEQSATPIWLKPVLSHSGSLVTHDKYSAFVEDILSPNTLLVPGNVLSHFPPTSKFTITKTFANDGIWTVVDASYNPDTDQTNVVVEFVRPILQHQTAPTNSYDSLPWGTYWNHINPDIGDGSISDFDRTDCSYVSPSTAITKFKEHHEIRVSFETQPAYLNIIDIIEDQEENQECSPENFDCSGWDLGPLDYAGVQCTITQGHATLPWGEIWDGVVEQCDVTPDEPVSNIRFVLEGNQTRYFKVQYTYKGYGDDTGWGDIWNTNEVSSTGSTFVIQQSDGNDGVWTVRRAYYDSRTNKTNVYVMEPVTSLRYPYGIIVEDIVQFRDTIGVNVFENTSSGTWSPEARTLAPTCPIQSIVGSNQLTIRGDMRRFFAPSSNISIDRHPAWNWTVSYTQYDRDTNTTTLNTVEPLPSGGVLQYVSGRPSWTVIDSWDNIWSPESEAWLTVRTQSTTNPTIWDEVEIYDLVTSI